MDKESLRKQKLKELLIAIFLGWLGGYQFCKHKYGLGILYLFTVGLFGIGWLIDCIHATSAYINYDDVVEPTETIVRTFRAKVVGVTFNCLPPNDNINRQDVIARLSRRDKLKIEQYTYNGNPAYKVVIDSRHPIDIGVLSSYWAKIIYNNYRNDRLEVTSFKKKGGFFYSDDDDSDLDDDLESDFDDDNFGKAKQAYWGCSIEIVVHRKN